MTRRAAVHLVSCGTAILSVAGSVHAQTGGAVTPQSQERIVEARTTVPAHVESAVELGMGLANPSRRVSDDVTVCLPGGGCITLEFSRSIAEQETFITQASNGALEIHGFGRASATADSGIWHGASALSRLTSTFSVEGSVPFLMQARGTGRSSVTLTGPGRTVFEYSDLSSPDVTNAVEAAGQLSAGTYTLVVDAPAAAAATAESSYVEIRFSAGGAPPSPPQCNVFVDRGVYYVGDVVRAGTVLLSNKRSEPVFVEVKMWLRLPNGHYLSASNVGADHSASIPPDTSHSFGPIEVMGVDDQIPKGVWEFGCRLLDPLTGAQLGEGRDLFEVR